MVEALRVLLTCVVVVSPCVIVAYVGGFAAVMGITVYRRRRPDALSDELDRFLEAVVGQSREELATSRGPADRPELLGVHAGGRGQFPGGCIGESERRSG